MKKLICLFIFLQLSGLAGAQKEARLCLQFGDSCIEKVETRFLYDGLSVERITLQAEETEKGKWMLTVPDSIFSQYRLSTFLISRRQNDSLVQIGMAIKVPVGDTTLFISNIFHFSPDSIPHLKLKTDSLVCDPSGKYLGMFFLLTNPTQTEVLNAQISTRGLELMRNPKGMQEYITDMLRQYPGSEVVGRWMLDKLFNISSCLSADELREIYDLFPEKSKQSYFGRKLRSYLEAKANFNYDHFPNRKLPETFTSSPQLIISDSSRYNLIIFSHSACGPCHAMIPLLKTIYADLKDKLEMTYISADDKKFVKHWPRIMREQAVPWRSLLSVDDQQNVLYTYQVSSYPTAYLVAPGGKFEKIDVRETAEKEKLYRLVLGAPDIPGSGQKPESGATDK